MAECCSSTITSRPQPRVGPQLANPTTPHRSLYIDFVRHCTTPAWHWSHCKRLRPFQITSFEYAQALQKPSARWPAVVVSQAFKEFRNLQARRRTHQHQRLGCRHWDETQDPTLQQMRAQGFEFSALRQKSVLLFSATGPKCIRSQNLLAGVAWHRQCTNGQSRVTPMRESLPETLIWQMAIFCGLVEGSSAPPPTSSRRRQSSLQRLWR